MDCDTAFKEYVRILQDAPHNHARISEAYQIYQVRRNQLNSDIINKANEKYKSVLQSNDAKAMWNMIDWSGETNKQPPRNHPSIGELSEHFTNLYEPIEDDGSLQDLESNVYIPVTDDPITINEIEIASAKIKKGGYDYPGKVIQLLLSSNTAIIFMLMNTILFNGLPSMLCTSLLSVIPKLGNLRLSSNYRGIQMQPLLANLFDKIITNRLIEWVKINDEQTAFQKGKGTVDQIFILRLMISLIRSHNMTLYVGFFDLSKAFDRSRYLLLKKLVQMGIGKVMLSSLKSIYSCRRCALKGFGKLSEVFETFTGIKQGASSSVILFIVFLDDIIDILKQKCIIEPILNNLHCLLHADDTLLISTSRNNFIHKCNVLINVITSKKMSLNYKKSGYMIINGKTNDTRCHLKIESGWLEYKTSHKYLGAIFNDLGNLREDVTTFLDKKHKDVNVKLANFMNKNQLAPIMMKLKVVNACVNSSLTYGCETWGNCPLNKIETLQRKALKIALGIRTNVPNDILYSESGFLPLKPIIYKRQLKFFHKMRHDASVNPTSPISCLFNMGMNENVAFLRHYKKLDEQFKTPNECYEFYAKECKTSCIENITLAGINDPYSALGTYCCMNPTLTSPKFYSQHLCNDTDRKLLTKYRTGSHNLRIQTGRHYREQRYERLCICKADIQTVDHALFRCERTADLRAFHAIGSDDINLFFENDNYIRTASILKSMQVLLDIKEY